jgi:hypothetical protein
MLCPLADADNDVSTRLSGGQERRQNYRNSINNNDLVYSVDLPCAVYCSGICIALLLLRLPASSIPAFWPESAERTILRGLFVDKEAPEGIEREKRLATYGNATIDG